MYPLNRQSFCKGIVLVVAVTASLTLMAARPAQAAPVPGCTPVSSASLDARLAAKADQGMRPFVGFVRRVAFIYQLDVDEALQRVVRYREAAAECASASSPANLTKPASPSDEAPASS